ncbi:hypothetical protein NLJ89_g8973 [Agrocybe chaxingu]|uniref:Uncharacterized protein n=1 Tax=Agrocybe chaxingu TaxID=84603 RepID=A0A9W8MTK9_9AGAR|nr:hypothetical protein NLJ89_g8973 [Agrocybe chaxingu]
MTLIEPKFPTSMAVSNTQLSQDGLSFDDDLPTFTAWVNYQHSMIVRMIPGDVLSLIFRFSVNEELYESNSFDFPSD